MVCVGLLSAMAGVAAHSLTRSRSASRQEALASLAGEIRSAQKRAIEENKIVALTLTSGASGRIGTEVGRSEPRLERVRDLSSDFPDLWLEAPSPTQITSPDPRVSNQWFRPERAALVFTPSGHTYSNLPQDAQQGYHLKLLRGSGGQWDLRFQPGGDFRLVELDLLPHPKPALDRSMTLTGGSDGVPVLQSIEALTSSLTPRDGSGILHLTPSPGQLVTFQVEATDSDGDDQLFLQATGVGHFTSERPVPMTFEATTGRWKACLTWRPPDTLAGPQELRFGVRDRNGNQATESANPLAIIDGFAQESVVFSATFGTDSSTRLYRVNPDGSGLRPLLPSSDGAQNPMVSPDHSQVAYWSAPDPSGPYELKVVGIQGASPRTVAPNLDLTLLNQDILWWTSDSSQIYLVYNHELRRYPAAGGPPTVVVPGFDVAWARISPDREKVAYMTNTSPARIEIRDLRTGSVQIVASEDTSLSFGHWVQERFPADFSQDSGALFYCGWDVDSMLPLIFRFNGSGPSAQVLAPGEDLFLLRCGPGNRLAYLTEFAEPEHDLRVRSYSDYTDPSSRTSLTSGWNAPDMIYDRLEFSSNGDALYWMDFHGWMVNMGVSTSLHLRRVPLDGTPVQTVCNLTSSYSTDFIPVNKFSLAR